ncbi:MAG: ExeM/NucH family extracellular endonuclease [Anaerolineaceae bacterium]|jgi:predicted extracellular nuclease
MNKTQPWFQVLTALILIFSAFGALPARPVSAGVEGLRISQVYGAGGNSGAIYTHDFIELFNASPDEVSLNGFSVQYASATAGASTTWTVHTLPTNAVIKPYSYFLIQEAKGNGGTTALPTPDAIGTIAMGGPGGRVALVNGTAALVGCPSTALDLVGYGTSVCFEGTGPAPLAGNATSAQRENAGCVDAGDNSSDFFAASVLPRNSSTRAYSCVNSAVISTVPVDLDTGILLDADLSVTFDRPVTVSDGWATLTCGTTTHTYTVTANNPTFIIDPDSEFIYEDACTLTIDADLVDQPLAEDYTTSFTVESAPATAPTVTNITPANGATWQNQDTPFEVSFDQVVTLTDGWYSIVCDPGGAPTFTVTGSGRHYTITPDAPLALGDTCTLNIDGSKVTSPYHSLSMSGTETSGFTVRANNDNPPDWLSSVPAQNGTDHPRTDPIALTFSEPVTISDSDITFTCERTGAVAFTGAASTTDPNTWLLTPEAELAGLQTCTITIPADKVLDNDTEDPPDGLSEDLVLTFSPAEGCGDPYTEVNQIQGPGASIPAAYLNKIVSVEGIVVADLQAKGNKRAFYIHSINPDEDPLSSEGLMIYTGTKPVAGMNPGDHVRIRGKAVEYSGVSEISPYETVWKCSTGNDYAPAILTMPFTSTNFEPYEGMLVKFEQPLTISEYYNFDRYGEIVLTNGRQSTPTAVIEPDAAAYAAMIADYQLNRIVLDDAQTAQNPAYLPHPDGTRYAQGTLVSETIPFNIFRGGDTITGLTAIMDYVANGWKLQQVGTAAYSSLNPRTEAPDMVPGEIRVSTINTLNYFVSLTSEGAICSPSGGVACRGADSVEERERQIAKTVAAVRAMDADVVGLLEIENDNPTKTAELGPDYALESIIAKLNEGIAQQPDGSPLYNYIATGPIGTDAIKVGIIYRTTNVSPIGNFATIDASVDPRFDSTKNRPALAMSFRDVHTGEIFTLAVNHLKSKGCPGPNDPPTNPLDLDQLDGQSCWNPTRVSAAEALVDWLEQDPTKAGSNKYLIMGDLNSYAKEDPIDAIKLGSDGIAGTADDYVDMVARFDEEFGRGTSYGYVYDGMVGYIDHALANQRLAAYVLDAKEWHINADEVDAIDYNLNYKPEEQIALYQPDQFRSSDHDPILVSLLLNHAPVAADDSYQTPMDTEINVPADQGVLANDRQQNIYEDVLLQVTVQPQHGTLVLNQDGSFVYTPDAGYLGFDTFKYLLISTPMTIQSSFMDEGTVTLWVGSAFIFQPIQID